MSAIQSTIEDVFPAPEFRKYQRETIKEVIEAFEEDDVDVVKLMAPTGSGKSIMLHTVMRYFTENYGRKNYFTTPLNSLVDQLQDDEFINNEIITIKGRNNYECILPEEDPGTTVDVAKCQRDSSFECPIKSDCNYYGLKERAIHHPETVTNISYLMAVGMTPTNPEAESFDKRYSLTVDECQSIESYALGNISFTVSKYTVPNQVWSNISIPDEEYEDDMDMLTTWLDEEVLEAVLNMKNALGDALIKSEDEVKQMERLEQFESRVRNFKRDVEEHDWVATIDVNIKKNKPNDSKIVFEPLFIGRFLDDMLWNNGEKIILSSATIPGGKWLREIGLDNRSVKSITVPSTFPVENRPIITGVSKKVGKMTYTKREENMVDAVEWVKKIADNHEGEKGMIHCRGYNYINMFRRSAYNNGYRDWYNNNFYEQDRDRREGSLEDWKNNDKQIFMSVAMDEGVDLHGDLCRWQCLLKVLYPNMNNKRVSVRMNKYCSSCDEIKWDVDDNDNKCSECNKSLGDWDWMNMKAATQIVQAYGRAVRSPEDEAVFYILDRSAIGLIRRSAELFPKWFLEAIDDIRIDPSRGM